jgi:predicted metal-dependent hydrolase
VSPLSPASLAALETGLAEYEAGRFFEAHEAWEEAWLAEEGLAKTFLQGLIQLAAAFHKGLVLHGPRGMATLLAHAREKLGHVARHDLTIAGLDLPSLLDRIDQAELAARRWSAGECARFEGEVVRVR